MELLLVSAVTLGFVIGIGASCLLSIWINP